MAIRIILTIEAEEDGPELESRINEICAEVVSDRLAGYEYPQWLTVTVTNEEEER